MFGLKKKDSNDTSKMLDEIKQKISSSSDISSNSNSANASSNNETNVFDEDDFLLAQFAMEDNHTSNNSTKLADSADKIQISQVPNNAIDFSQFAVVDKNIDSKTNSSNDDTSDIDYDIVSDMVSDINAQHKIVDEDNSFFEDEVLTSKIQESDAKMSTNDTLSDSNQSKSDNLKQNNNNNANIGYLDMKNFHKTNDSIGKSSFDSVEQQKPENESTQMQKNDVSGNAILDDLLVNIKENNLNSNLSKNQNIEYKVQQNQVNVQENIPSSFQNHVSDKVREQAKSSIEDLMQAVKSQIVQSKMQSESAMGKTVEQFLVSIIEPKIISFLDKNLVQIVNNIVEKEIKKIVSENK